MRRGKRSSLLVMRRLKEEVLKKKRNRSLHRAWTPETPCDREPFLEHTMRHSMTTIKSCFRLRCHCFHN
jgi:hypothetical protein